MSDLVQTDKEAMSALKQHGEKIIWAIVIVLAGYFGWQYYQNNYAKVDTVAADLYTAVSSQNEEITLAAQNPDPEVASQVAAAREEMYKEIDKLVAGHPNTVYAWQALMIKARNQADTGDSDGAIKSLEAASKVAVSDQGLIAISRLQHARVLLDKGDSDAALAIAEATLPEGFEPSRQEVLGDIYVVKRDLDAAKTAYNKAWEILSARYEDRALLSLKMQSLGMTVTPIEPKYQVVVGADSQASTIEDQAAAPSQSEDQSGVKEQGETTTEKVS